MSFVEFKTRVNLIIHFACRLNEELVSNDIKRILVKVYADTLGIKLSDKMADGVVQQNLPAMKA
jgi:hypothetical protein